MCSFLLWSWDYGLPRDKSAVFALPWEVNGLTGIGLVYILIIVGLDGFTPASGYYRAV